MKTSDAPSPRPQATRADPPVHLHYAPAMARARHPSVLHSGLSLPGFFAMHLMGTLFPVTAGLLLYGWRALLLTGMVIGTALGALAVWRRIGARGKQLHAAHVFYMALLLSLTLPVHLVTTDAPFRDALPALWAIPLAAGVLIVMAIWLTGGTGAGRIHPVLIVHLLVVVFFKQALVPHWVLQRDHLFLGDVARSVPELEARDIVSTWDGWTRTPREPGRDGLYLQPAAEQLQRYTTAQERPARKVLKLDGLLRDQMPPLEDLIIGGQPGPIGTSSAIAVIIGGLFLLYRGVIDFRIPLLIYLATVAALLLLPVPVMIREVTDSFGAARASGAWQWASLRNPGVGIARAVTFANYEVMAGPLLYVAFFLATSPAIRPMSRRGRVIYAMLIGVAAAVLQLHVSVAFGAYLALLLVSLLTPVFDRIFRPRPLV